MGLFSFLARKQGGLPKTKVSAFREPLDSDSTTSGSISLSTHGSRPAAAYRVNNLDTFSRGRQSFTRSSVSLGTASVEDHSAPAPGIPRFREDSPERPSTAPTSQASRSELANSVSQPKSKGPRGPPPLSFRMVRLGVAGPRSRPESRSSITTATSAYRGTSTISRTASTRNVNGPGYKDILDAQSEIRPADFRARVRASGARDYGEDVADRNIAQNGLDLHLPSQPSPRYHKSSMTLSADAKPVRESLARRRSVNTYMPLGSLKVMSRSSPDVVQPLAPTPELVKKESSPPAAGGRAARTTRAARDSIVLAKRKAVATMSDNAKRDVPSSTGSILPSSSARLSALGLETSPPRARHSLHALQMSVSSMPSPKLEEIAENSPSFRTRSVRGWSASSSAPTTADSTAPSSQQPPSLHTANTSLVDLPATAPLPSPTHLKSITTTIPAINDTINHNNDDGDGNGHDGNDDDTSSYYPASEGGGEGHARPGSSKAEYHFHYNDDNDNNSTHSFNLDDYLSFLSDHADGDDGDSIRRRSAAESEKSLLFNDAGYGAGGLQLPGLPEPIPAVAASPPVPAPAVGGLKSIGGGDDKGIKVGWRSRLGPGMFMFDQRFYFPEEDEEEEEELGQGPGERERGYMRERLDEVGNKGLENGIGREANMEWERRQRRYVLDTGAHDEEDFPEELGKGEVTPICTDIPGKRSATLTALCLSGGGETHTEQIEPVQGQEQRRVEEVTGEGRYQREGDKTVDIAAAVRLRKQVRRAKRMVAAAAAQTVSVSKLRPAGPTPVPVVHVEPGTYEEGGTLSTTTTAVSNDG